MFATIKRNYLAGRINEAGVQNAVKRGQGGQASALKGVGIYEQNNVWAD